MRWLLVLSLFINQFLAQNAVQIAKLDNEINETSGLLIEAGKFYTFNDSGGEAMLYEIDTISGKVIRRIPVLNAKNVDWEAITSDDQFIYIGDIGNNYGKRKNLTIYKCPRSGLVTGSLEAESIRISYTDQFEFKHDAHKHEYDAESLFTKDGKLFLMSKNWIKDESKIYEVPLTPGVHELTPLYTIETSGKVTDAYFSPVGSRLFLIGYGDFPFITIVKDYDEGRWNSKLTIPINSPNGFQTEGINYKGSTIYYSSEQVEIFSAELAKYDLTEVESMIQMKCSSEKIKISCKEKIKTLELTDRTGKMLFSSEPYQKSAQIHKREIQNQSDFLIIRIVLTNKTELIQRISTV